MPILWWVYIHVFPRSFVTYCADLPYLASQSDITERIWRTKGQSSTGLHQHWKSYQGWSYSSFFFFCISYRCFQKYLDHYHIRIHRLLKFAIVEPQRPQKKGMSQSRKGTIQNSRGWSKKHSGMMILHHQEGDGSRTSQDPQSLPQDDVHPAAALSSIWTWALVCSSLGPSWAHPWGPRARPWGLRAHPWGLRGLIPGVCGLISGVRRLVPGVRGLIPGVCGLIPGALVGSSLWAAGSSLGFLVSSLGFLV